MVSSVVSDASTLPEVKPLRHSEIPNVTKTTDTAFFTEADLIGTYRRMTPDRNRSLLMRQRQKLAVAILMASSIHRHAALSVAGGDGILIFTDPDSALSRRRRIADKLLRVVVEGANRIIYSIDSKEQKVRTAEWDRKMEAAVASSIGDEVKEMISLDMLAVAPARQGLGYGTALVLSVAEKADAEGRSVWVITNQNTASYYAQFGFSTVKEVLFGEKNPTYNGPPVIASIMVRKPKD
ncbi:hypothetical protein B0H21DRAFT_537951 [Amylocystis lapponica]|nr:hypothetical protein B0H21DRAFT_537951 [Amylocystis lapponica]